ncbi:MAG: rRNA maturation RNase YbeY [Cycloclasticus sp.]|nr:MAG: rRNA maturation RNase YbeY [Cycloclasticus sp.]
MSVDIQIASDLPSLPTSEDISSWVSLATQQRKDAEVLIRLVDDSESAELNQAYRQKQGSTNVLSFPFERPEGLPADALTEDVLGDLVICAPVVEKEAKLQGKDVQSHWAHMIIHGCLHLQGYDHIDAPDRETMEALEIQLLSSININNPYEIQ